jgi:hypothetical protein
MDRRLPRVAKVRWCRRRAGPGDAGRARAAGRRTLAFRAAGGRRGPAVGALAGGRPAAAEAAAEQLRRRVRRRTAGAATAGAGFVRQLRARRRGPAGAAAHRLALAAGPAQPGGRPAHQARRRHRRPRLPGLRAAAGAGAFRRTSDAARRALELGREPAGGHAVLGVGHGGAARCRDRQPLQPARALHRVAHAGRRQRPLAGRIARRGGRLAPRLRRRGPRAAAAGGGDRGRRCRQHRGAVGSLHLAGLRLEP